MKNKQSELLKKLKAAASGDLPGIRPVDIGVYSTGERCPKCGLYIANDRARNEIDGGNGTNLCWAITTEKCTTDVSVKITPEEARLILSMIKEDQE